MKTHNVLEIFSGSTVDAGFIKKHLETKGINCIVENKYDETITANWTDIKPIVGSCILVKSTDFEKADKILKEYLNSRENTP